MKHIGGTQALKEMADSSLLVAAPLGLCPRPLDVHMQISLGMKASQITQDQALPQ